MLLVHPPVSKPCEPPPGLAYLAAALRAAGRRTGVLDANLEGLFYLLGRPLSQPGGPARRAWRNRHRNLAALRTPALYRSPGRYRKAVFELQRALEAAASPVRVGLAEYQDPALSPVRSADLARAAREYETNPYYGYFSRRLPAVLEAGGYRCVGFSLNYLSQALCAFAMMGFVKARCPGVSVVVGGGLATSWARRPGWNRPFAGLVDAWVSGPAENEWCPVPAVPVPPAYGLFSLDRYLSPGRVLAYRASGGCYWGRCAFCPERAEGSAYEPVAPARVLEDLQNLGAEHRPAMVHFTDNALSPALLQALARGPVGTPWYGFARPEAPLADPDFARALYAGGCRMLQLGVESGDARVLEALGKGTRPEICERVLSSLHAAGIATYVYLLFGTPPETLDEARATLDFTVRNAGRIDYMNVAVFNLPLGGTDYEDLPVKPFYEGDLSLYGDFEHPGGWSRREVRRFLDREFKRHPAVAGVVRRQVPAFTCNHAVFLGQETAPSDR